MLKSNQTQPNTFFFVKVFFSANEYELGPYFNAEEATTILVDFVPAYTRALLSSEKEIKYSAEIHECILENLSWQTVSILIREDNR